MNDFGMLKDVLDSISDSNHNLIVLGGTLIGFIFVNILTVGTNIWYQFKLKNKDKEIIKYEKIEEFRLQVLIDLYILLEELTYYDGAVNQESYILKSNNINSYLSKNKLFIEKDIYDISDEFNNYFLTVLQDFRKKDFRKEKEYLETFINKFNT